MMNAMIPLSNLDQIFNTFFTGQGECRATGCESGDSCVVPRANVFEGDQEYRIDLEMAGVDRKDVQIDIEGEALTVQATRETEVPEGFKARRREHAPKLTLKRSFRLGKEIDADKISAKLDNGVLRLTLQKSEQALPRRIEIR